MKKVKREIRRYGIGDAAWEEFFKAYEEAYTNPSSELYQEIFSGFKQLLDAELGEGTFRTFVKNQMRLVEYQASLPKFSMCNDGGFLVPKLITKGRTRREDLQSKILRESLEKDGAFELRERVLDSNARRTTREKYGFIIDLLFPRDMFLLHELCDDVGRHASSREDKAVKTFLAIKWAKRQNDTVTIGLMESYFPDLYAAFLSLFREMM